MPSVMARYWDDSYDDSSKEEICFCDDCRDERASDWELERMGWENRRREAELDAMIDDRGPEDFGFEDLGSYSRSNVVDRGLRLNRRVRSGTPKSTGAPRDKGLGRRSNESKDRSWSRQTRNRHQWEVSESRNGGRINHGRPRSFEQELEILDQLQERAFKPVQDLHRGGSLTHKSLCSRPPSSLA
jgi:hypothetical protein